MSPANNLTQQNELSNPAPPLTPELVNRIAAQSGIEPKFIRLWARQLVTGFAGDQDGTRLIAIWLDLLGREEAK